MQFALGCDLHLHAGTQTEDIFDLGSISAPPSKSKRRRRDGDGIGDGDGDHGASEGGDNDGDDKKAVLKALFNGSVRPSVGLLCMPAAPILV